MTSSSASTLPQIRQGHPDLEMAYQLGQGFVMMLAERRGGDLDTWLTQAEQSGLPEFKKMANGIRLDYAAVKMAFTRRLEQWPSGSAGQLLEASETDRVRKGEL